MSATSSTASDTLPGSTRPQKKVRNVGIDLLRIVSIIAVAVGHIYADDLSFKSYLEIWRMPLFFFLSGFFFTRGRPFRRELKSRVKTLAIPYIVWAMLMSLVALSWQGGTTDDFWSLMESGWYGGSDQVPPWWAFWFISVLFFATVFRRFLERFPSWVAWVVAIAGLVLAEALPQGSELGVIVPQGMGLALPCMFYILCGEAFRYNILPRLASIPGVTTSQRKTPFSANTVGFLGIGLFLVGVVAVMLGVPPHNIKFSGFGWFLITPLVGVMMVCAMVLIFSTWVNRVVKWSRPIIDELVRTNTVVVLAHGWIIIELYRAGFSDNFTVLVLTMGLSWLLGLVINASPFAPVLGGVPLKPFWQERMFGTSSRRRISSASCERDGQS